LQGRAGRPIGDGMTGDDKGTRKPAPGGRRKGDPARDRRLRAALRDNLRRRKAQTRGRAAVADAPHDSAGIVPEFADDKPKG
jgi:hypothetical protein